MPREVILHTEEFHKLRTNLFNLDHSIRELESVLNAQLYDSMSHSLEQIHSALQRAYDLDLEEQNNRCDHYNTVQKSLGINSIWSLYEVDDLNGLHPFKDAKTISYKDHWGREFTVTADIDGPTWKDLYLAADKCIGDSNDTHHIFIEKFVPDENDASVLKLLTGS